MMNKKWSSEEVERVDGHLLVIFCEGETRGSILLLDENESIKWMKIIDYLNLLPNAKE